MKETVVLFYLLYRIITFLIVQVTQMPAIILGSLALFVETRLSEKDVANPPGGFRPSLTTTNTTSSMNSKNKSQFLQDNERERESKIRLFSTLVAQGSERVGFGLVSYINTSTRNRVTN